MDAAQEAELRQHLSDESQNIAIDAEYTGRQHLKAGQQWRSRVTFLGLPVTLISAATAGGAGLSVLLGGASWLTAGLAAVGAVIAAGDAYFKPSEQAAAHSIKGAKYLALRNEARRFRKLDLVSDRSLDTLTDRIHMLGRQYDDLRATEPRELPKGLYEGPSAPRFWALFNHRHLGRHYVSPRFRTTFPVFCHVST